MTLTDSQKRDIGQHFVLGFHSQEIDENVTSLIRDYHVGNIILMKRNVKGFEQIHKLVQDLQKLAKDSGHERPLMIGIDQENGLVSGFSLNTGTAGTQFPGAMALAATRSTELAEKVTAASGKEMRLAGINWAYSPVADVNSDHRNPVIGVRSYGDDPAKVSEYVCAVSKGLTDSGIAPSAKHFPGHGDTHVDSHLGLPRIMKTKAELEATELVPFKALVQAGIASIMTGHMALPTLTGDDLPCSLSRKVTHDLLREELKYDGLIVTDCLEMDAVKETYGIEKGSVMALKAGADIIMICHTYESQLGAVELAWEAVNKGELDITDSKRRIAVIKDQFTGGWDHVLNSTLDNAALSKLKSTHALLSKEAYASSTTIISDPSSILPLKPTTNVLLFTPQTESLNKAVDDAEGVLRTKDGNLRNTAGPSDISFSKSIAQRASTSHHTVYTKELSIPSDLVARNNLVIVFATRNADRATWQLDYLRKLVKKAASAKVIIVSTCGPYDLIDPGEALEFAYAYVATYEFTPEALEAAVGVIFGEVKATGSVPVKIHL